MSWKLYFLFQICKAKSENQRSGDSVGGGHQPVCVSLVQ